jgi:hypothetical protein
MYVKRNIVVRSYTVYTFSAIRTAWGYFTPTEIF